MTDMSEKADWEKARDWLKQETITQMSAKVWQPSYFLLIILYILCAGAEPF